MTSFADAFIRFTAPASVTLRDFRKSLGAGARVVYRGKAYVVAAVADAGPVLGQFAAIVADGAEPVFVPMIEVFRDESRGVK